MWYRTCMEALAKQALCPARVAMSHPLGLKSPPPFSRPSVKLCTMRASAGMA